jgi:hypothetical protein
MLTPADVTRETLNRRNARNEHDSLVPINGVEEAGELVRARAV